MSVSRRFFPKPAHGASLAELAELGGARAKGEGRFTDIAILEEAGPEDITFFTNSDYLDAYKASKAGACILGAAHDDSAAVTALISDNPRLTFAKICAFFYPPSVGRSERAAKIDETASVHPNATVENGAEIGKGVTIGGGSYIGYNCLIGDNCRIGSNVTITHARLAEGVVVQSNTAIGEEGFGFAVGENGEFVPIPHLGEVIIGKNSHIFAGCSIVRGSLKPTVIGDNCRIDAQVQVAHNVILGTGVIISAQVGISGSCEIGDYARIGGQSGIMGHLRVGARANIFPKSGVMEDVEAGKSVGGAPAIPLRDFLRYSRKRNE